MELAALIRDLHRLNHQLERYERRFGLMSETFYELYSAGYEPRDDAWVLDFTAWAGLYDTWRDRQQRYREMVASDQVPVPDLFDTS